jgi:hypothetical protein
MTVPENMDELMTEYMGELETPEPAPAEPTNPEPAPGPDLSAQFETFKTEMEGQYNQKVTEYEKTINEQQQSLSRMEGLLQGAYNNVHQPPAPAAPAELEFSEKDLLADPVGVVNKVAEQRAQARADAAIQEFQNQLSPLMNNTIERGFQGELASVANSEKGKRYWKYVEKDVQAVFEKNPALKASAGAVELAFNNVIGQNILSLEHKISEEQAAGAPAAPQVFALRTPPAPAGRPGSTAPPVEPAKKDETVLSPAQQRVMNKFSKAFSGIEWNPSDFLPEEHD